MDWRRPLGLDGPKPLKRDWNARLWMMSVAAQVVRIQSFLELTLVMASDVRVDWQVDEKEARSGNAVC